MRLFDFKLSEKAIDECGKDEALKKMKDELLSIHLAHGYVKFSAEVIAADSKEELVEIAMRWLSPKLRRKN